MTGDEPDRFPNLAAAAEGLTDEGPTLVDILGLADSTDGDPLGSGEIVFSIQAAAAQMARVPVAVSLDDWAGFTALERELVAQAYEKTSLALACLTTVEPQRAAQAYAQTDMRALIQVELRTMARDILSQPK